MTNCDFNHFGNSIRQPPTWSILDGRSPLKQNFEPIQILRNFLGTPPATIGSESRRLIVKYPSSSVLINTPGVASIAAGLRDGHLKLALMVIGDTRRRGWVKRQAGGDLRW